MKATNKAHAAFTTKLSAILTKFKDSSTVHVGHEQLKNFFGDYSLKEVIIPFITKMDTSDHLSDRQKKEYSKVYIALIDCYKQKIIMDQYFEKIMQSLSKKTVGVSEVIGFVCKTLLNRIQDPENLFPFVSIIVSIFRNHIEVPKILKQLIEVIDPSVISGLQEDIIMILHDKINNAKNKNQFLDTILSLVLNLEEKLTVQVQIHGFLVRYLKNQDWNCRKTCVDIGNALLIINHEIAENIHRSIKELKYDKIKHVRESVNNYEILYKQTYGEESQEKPTKHYTSFREAKIKSQHEKVVAKSPIPVSQKYEQVKKQKSGSLEKVGRGKKLNENFFKNAKNSDVIKIGQNMSCLVAHEQEEKVVEQNLSFQMPEIQKTLEMVNEKTSNFQAYLKNRGSPKVSVSPKASDLKQKQSQRKEILFISSQSEESKAPPKFNYQNQFENFKKKTKQLQPQSIKKDTYQEESSSFSSDIIVKGNQNDISALSFGPNNVLFEQFMGYFTEFQKKICERLDQIDSRIDNLEREKSLEQESSRMLKGRVTSQKLESEPQRQMSPRSFYYNDTVSQSQYESVQPLESNLQEKVRVSIMNENWDEAFTLALTNNKKNILLNLLQRCAFPTDKTVQQCILLQIKKLLDNTSALKWLKFYLTEKTLSTGRLLKLKEDLLRRGQGDSKSYQMMKQLVLNEIAQKLDNLH